MQTEVRVVLKATGFMCLVVVGLPANLSVLFLFCRLHFSRGRLQPNDFILCSMATMNLVVLLCRSLPQTLFALGVRHFMSDWGCKVVIFAYRMGRAMSICVTTLLGCYQSVSIAPSTPRWTLLKHWLPAHLLHAIIVFWFINAFVCYGAIMYPQAPPINGSVPEFTMNLEFCLVVYPGPLTYRINGITLTLRDMFFVSVMVLAAVYMLLVLYRHRQQVKGLQGASRASEGASQAVLLLVCTYVALFTLENILWGYSLTVPQVMPYSNYSFCAIQQQYRRTPKLQEFGRTL
uniref:Vomeronasal type-1 receptor n=1 Tax=Scleropages formosus TaxID=113540 RepID=A0A8C9R6T1_SCLFO